MIQFLVGYEFQCLLAENFSRDRSQPFPFKAQTVHHNRPNGTILTKSHANYEKNVNFPFTVKMGSWHHIRHVLAIEVSSTIKIKENRTTI